MSEGLKETLEKLGPMTFDHVAIAVRSINEAAPVYMAMGLGPMEVEDVPDEQVRVALFRLQNGCKIELLEPLSEQSPMHKYLQKRGPGIHHFCLRVKDINTALEKAKAAGLRVINDPPNHGAHHCLVSFLHPASTGGVLIELSQPEAQT